MDTMKRILFVAMLVFGTADGATPAPTLLVYGDSLSAAYGINRELGWVTLLQERLRRENFNYRVVNASISGETSSGGAARIGKVLEQMVPEVMILALGANDGLRGLPVGQFKANLSNILRAAQSRRARVLLVGMRVPPNYGPRYTREFEQTFRDLADEYRIPLVPFLLEGIADRREYFQSDTIHPTAEGQPVMLETVWRQLVPLLRK
jgi:acyl-CoA thioesterase-1